VTPPREIILPSLQRARKLKTSAALREVSIRTTNEHLWPAAGRTLRCQHLYATLYTPTAELQLAHQEKLLCGALCICSAPALILRRQQKKKFDPSGHCAWARLSLSVYIKRKVHTGGSTKTEEKKLLGPPPSHETWANTREMHQADDEKSQRHYIYYNA